MAPIYKYCVIGVGLLACLSLVLMYAMRTYSERPSNTVEPDNIEAMDVFDTDGRHWSGDIPDKSVASYNVNIETARRIFHRVEYRTGSFRWKGGFLAVLRMKNGAVLRLAVSYYGGMLLVIPPEDTGYYQTIDGSRDTLDKLVQEVVENVFIPHRLEHLNSHSATSAKSVERGSVERGRSAPAKAGEVQ